MHGCASERASEREGRKEGDDQGDGARGRRRGNAGIDRDERRLLVVVATRGGTARRADGDKDEPP